MLSLRVLAREKAECLTHPDLKIHSSYSTEQTLQIDVVVAD
jgi:hypothetical protein